ncbi:hypothetical protein OPT61_g3100 [Boeremia exigua]|uniref:Uncharacterized protein n=1 Tax=Boeremia exigua TaxID=749465 RepID=A0ACC2IJ15_9PLEO|nr:hypothetical protein OPT61_g3100 [Boeremia exigua]
MAMSGGARTSPRYLARLKAAPVYLYNDKTAIDELLQAGNSKDGISNDRLIPDRNYLPYLEKTATEEAQVQHIPFAASNSYITLVKEDVALGGQVGALLPHTKRHHRKDDSSTPRLTLTHIHAPVATKKTTATCPGSPSHTRTCSHRKDYSNMAKLEAYFAPARGEKKSTIPDADGVAGSSCSFLSSRFTQLKHAACSDNALARTVADIVLHFESAASIVGCPVDEIAILVGHSRVELGLNEVLQLFCDDKADNIEESMFSERLMSTLLANEKPRSPFSALAPFESAANWLSCENNDLYSRIACISTDIISALNGKSPSSGTYPFEGAGISTATRRILFCYKPNRNITLVGPEDLKTTFLAKETLAMAAEELIPLLTLAQLSPDFPFPGAQWREEFITMECRPRSVPVCHSGPWSILTAVYRANDQVIPPTTYSPSEEAGLAWRIRLACSRRLLDLMRGKQPSGHESDSLYSLLSRHAASIVHMPPRHSDLKRSQGLVASDPARKGPQKKRGRYIVEGDGDKIYPQVQKDPASAEQELTTGGGVSFDEPLAAIRPFAREDYHACPYFATGQGCESKQRLYTFTGVTRHVLLMHHSKGEGPAISHAINPFEDGSFKIPCRNGCPTLFTSYQQSNHHAKKTSTCSWPKPTSLTCPWSPYIDCRFTSSSPKGMANHVRAHIRDPRSPYQCSKDCGEYHADLYMLSQHEEDCKGVGHKRKLAMFFFRLDGCTENIAPNTIIVGRASSTITPLSWKNTKATNKDGLPAWGAKILEHYNAYKGYETGPASLRVSANLPTRHIPAPDVNDSHHHTDFIRWHKNRAFMMTQGIISDIEAANANDVIPTVLSVGVDAWACDVRMVLPWLQSHQDLRFKIVLRMNDLFHGMRVDHTTEHCGAYWAEYEPAAILNALLHGPGADAAVDDLIKTWKTMQSLKDTTLGISLEARRNHVDFSREYMVAR